ncbi:F-box protein SKIP8 [Linum perenne]
MALLGSALCYKVNSVEIGEHIRLPSSGIDNWKKIRQPDRTSLEKCSAILATRQHWRPYLQIERMRIGKSGSSSTRLSSFRPCRVASGESEGMVIGENNTAPDEQTLTHDLQIAIEEEDYARAAKIRDSLRELQADSESSVLAANSRFYNAFRKGDLASMQRLWSKGENVCCVHPGASGVLGHDHVMESWELVWMNYDFPLEIELKNVRVHFRGDMGYVTCVEFIRTTGGSSWGAQFVTNVFERIDGHWFICIHHASPVDL